MAFYLKPPSGFEQLESVKVFGITRIFFLKEMSHVEGPHEFRELLSKAENVAKSECLIEGSRKDRMTHFLLRLVCCCDVEMSKVFADLETQFFCHRLSSMSEREVVKLLQTTFSFVRHIFRSKVSSYKVIQQDYYDLYMILNMILNPLRSWRKIVNKYMNDCNEEFFQVPFQFALSLVAGRQIIMKDGIAYVPYAKLHIVLSSIFKNIVEKGLYRAKVVSSRSVYLDGRFHSVLQELKCVFQTVLGLESEAWYHPSDEVRLSDIDKLSKFFPLCMNHLHRTLRIKHRLKHRARIQYTLFLKDVGLPIGESLHFWQSEYSQIPKDGHNASCQQRWETDKKRYTYNIRHLYGLEGSRINYKSHSCSSLQGQAIGHNEEGGCPFVHFDQKHLSNLLETEDIGAVHSKEILTLTSQKRYTKACQRFLFAKFSAISPKNRLCDPLFSPIPDKDMLVISRIKEDQCVITQQQNRATRDGKADLTEGLNKNFAVKKFDPGINKESDDGDFLGFQVSNHNQSVSVENASVEENEQRVCEQYVSNEPVPRQVGTNLKEKRLPPQITLTKPVQFYESYKNLIEGLQEI